MKCRHHSKPTKDPPANGQGNARIKVQDQPFFGMNANREDMKNVAAYIRRIRAPRFGSTFGSGKS